MCIFSDSYKLYIYIGASLVAPMVKKSPFSAEDLGSVPGLGRFPGGGMAMHSSILA